MKEAVFTVVLIDGKPWIKWEQYDTTYLKIWKAKSEKPYCKYAGITSYLDEEMKKQLRALI